MVEHCGGMTDDVAELVFGGPMMGQANVFFRYFPEKIQPAIDRYQGESGRLFGVLDRHLADHEWLAGDYSIADIAIGPWIRTLVTHYKAQDRVGWSELRNVPAWYDRFMARPAVQRGILVPAAG